MQLPWILLLLGGFTLIDLAASKGKSRVPHKRGKQGRTRYDVTGTDGSLNRITLRGRSKRNWSAEEKLLTYLFANYDPVARGVLDVKKSVQVDIEYILLRIHGLDERSQTLTTTGLIITEWIDERLTWNPSEFGNLTDIIITPDKPWLPELAIMNGAEDLNPNFERIRVLLKHTGELHWEPGGIFRTICDIDITYFPFDEQACPLVIGAYSYYTSKMNITNTNFAVITPEFRLNGEWHVSSGSAHWNETNLACCPEIGYPHVVFVLNLKRRHMFYVMNIIMPCLMLSLLILFGFFLPPDSGEKISLGISVLLAFTVFLLMVADIIPRTSLAIPLMVIYLTVTMALGSVSVGLTVIVLHTHHYKGPFKMPPVLKRIFLIHIARALGVNTSLSRRHSIENGPSIKNGFLRNQADNVDQESSENSGRSHIKRLSRRKLYTESSGDAKTTPLWVPRARGKYCDNDNKDNVHLWQEFAKVLDRLFFWILFCMMAASSGLILLNPRYTKTR